MTKCGHTFKSPSLEGCKCEKCGTPFADWFEELKFQTKDEKWTA